MHSVPASPVGVWGAAHRWWGEGAGNTLAGWLAAKAASGRGGTRARLMCFYGGAGYALTLPRVLLEKKYHPTPIIC